MKIERKRAYFKNKKNQNSALKSQKKKKRLDIEIFTKIIIFTINQNDYKLWDIWIFNSDANSYIYNNLLRFKFERITTENDKLIVDKTVYSIKAFRSVDIFI